MWSLFDGALTSNGYSAISVAGMTSPLGRMNCLLDGWPEQGQGSAVVPTPEVAPLSATVVAMVPSRIPCCSSLLLTPMMYCRLVRRCFISFCPFAAILFRVMAGIVGEMLLVSLEVTCGLLLLGTTGGSSGSCSSTSHGRGDRQE
jgi:hypothetical protein